MNLKFAVLGAILVTIISILTAIEADPVAKRMALLSAEHGYVVQWYVDEKLESIEFTVMARTEGYVGFGISSTGRMAGADMIIGGVGPDGLPYFKDYHVINGDNHMPFEDKNQNWRLLGARQDSELTENTITVLKFRRSLRTCDRNDLDVTGDTTKIIWAIGNSDGIQQHSQGSRGAFPVNLLDPSPTATDEDLRKFQAIRVTQYVTLSSRQKSVYKAQLFKYTSASKTHIVAFKPNLGTPEARKHTHHFNVYKCTAPVGKDPVEYFDRFIKFGAALVSDDCNTDIYAWSLGGRTLKFPEDVGFSFGTESVEYYYVSLHVDNAEGLDGVEFATGFTIYHSSNLRKHEAAILVINSPTLNSLLIPPSTRDWKIVSHCTSECTRAALAETQGMNLLNVNLHSHLSGQKMRLRQFRNGDELPWIANDEHYDPHYQENRPLKKGYRILPGDQLTLECTYDSNWANGSSVVGGPGTTDEMCFAFIYYYPKLNLTDCGTGYKKTGVAKTLGVGSDYSRNLNLIPWSDELKQTLQQRYLHEHDDYTCFSQEFVNHNYTQPKIKYPEVTIEYKPVVKSCSVDTFKGQAWSPYAPVQPTFHQRPTKTETGSPSAAVVILKVLRWVGIGVLVCIFLYSLCNCYRSGRRSGGGVGGGGGFISVSMDSF